MSNQTSVSFIQQKWAQEFCPQLNGVTFADGRIIHLEIDRFDDSCKIEIDKLGVTTVATFIRENPDALVALTELCSLELPGPALRISAGGGGFGGDGYIARTNLESNHLRWILFFDNANEFVKLGAKSSVILAETNLGEIWMVPFDNPAAFEVQPRLPQDLE